MQKITFFLLALVFSSGLFVNPVLGQIHLERISVTERSDQMGFVVRFHFSERVDDYAFSQPGTNRVDMWITPGTIQTDGTALPDDRVIDQVLFLPLDGRFGFQLTIDENHSLEANLYRDVNPNHLLLSLERTATSALESLVAANQPLFETEEPAADAHPEPRPETPATETDVVEDATETSVLERLLSERNPATLDRITPGDPLELYMRAVHPHPGYQSHSSWLLRPVNIHGQIMEPGLGIHPWMDHPLLAERKSREGPFDYRIYSPQILRSNNSDLPMGQNDGVLWQGVGLNYWATAGAGVQYGPFTAVFRPQFAYSENIDFPLQDRDLSYIPGYNISMLPNYSGSEFQDFLMFADYPIRFGADSFSEFDLGDSFIQAEFKGFAAGVSNERLWTGPAVHNPLLFSTHAPGFLHGFLGTVEPYDTSFGRFEGRWIWGGLRESDYFNGSGASERRFITALSMNYSPSVLPGLSVGFTRAAVTYSGDGTGVSDLFLVFRPSLPPPDDNTSIDDYFFNKTSFFARWVFPSANFEAYAEWGRNDDRRRFRDLIAEPELNRGFVLGFLKNFELASGHSLLLNTEVTNLENSSVTATKRDFNIWYTNPVIGQGFTNRGQVLGAGIGPGSSTQFIGLQYYNRWGRAGISGRRIAHNIDRLFKHEDFLRDNFARWPQFFLLAGRHEIEIQYRFDLLVFLPYGLELEAGYSIGKTDNRFYLRGVDVNNYQYSFTLRYNLLSLGR